MDHVDFPAQEVDGFGIHPPLFLKSHSVKISNISDVVNSRNSLQVIVLKQEFVQKVLLNQEFILHIFDFSSKVLHPRINFVLNFVGLSKAIIGKENNPSKGASQKTHIQKHRGLAVIMSLCSLWGGLVIAGNDTSGDLTDVRDGNKRKIEEDTFVD